MILTPDMIEGIMMDFARRVHTISMVGGVSMKDVVEGKSIPEGWVLDVETEYYIPSDLFLDLNVRIQ